MKLISLKEVLATTFTLACLFFLQRAEASIQFSNEFWISTNANGNMFVNGTGGTLDNPFDGSTVSNFDVNMNSFPPNSTIHILAGTYQTYGDNAGNFSSAGGFWVKSGQKILGSGIGVTILQHPFGTVSGSFMLNSGWVNGCSNAEISDLTCDCNYTSGSYSYDGIELSGSENAVRRVRVINNSSESTSNPEAFGIVLSPWSNNDSEGNIIEECEVSQYAGGTGISAILINGGSGIIRNNRVFLPIVQNMFAFNGADMHDVLIEGNYVNGGSDAVYGDTEGTTNLIIAHNTFINTGHAVSLNGQVRNNITIAFNTITLTNPPLYSGIYAFGTWTSVGSFFTNITIIGNNVQTVSGVPVSALNFYNATGIIFADNKIDSSITNFLSNCTGVNMYDNYDLFGNYLPALNIPTLGGTAVTSFGLSLVGSAGASPALTALGLPSNPLVLVTNGSTQPVTFSTNVTISGVLNYLNMVAQLLAGTGVTTSTVNTSTGQVVTVNANSQTNGFGNIVSYNAAEFAMSTNATIWNSLSVTNTSATNWATLNVTPSNAVLSVYGVSVAILQTNGILNAKNGLSTTVSNTLAAVNVASGSTSLNWTNTTPKNVVFYIDSLTGDVKYNGSTIFSGINDSAATVILQPNEYVAVTATSGHFNAYWHPF
jgi:hypothetical protein